MVRRRGARLDGGAEFLRRGGRAGAEREHRRRVFRGKLGPRARERVDATAALVVLVTAASVAWYAIALGRFTTGQTTGSGLPLELTFYPMGAGAVCMTVFALAQLFRRRQRRILRSRC